QHNSIFVEVEIRMGHIPKQSPPGIIRSRKIVAVMKQPAGTGIRGEILIGKHPSPPAQILHGLKPSRGQAICIGLLDTASIERGVSLVLDTPSKSIHEA